MRQGYRLAHIGVLMIVGGAVAIMAAEPVTATTEDEEEWLETETDTFVVEYKDGYEDDAAYIGNVSENAYAELQETFPENVSEPSFEEPIHIRVYPEDMWSRSDYALNWKDTKPVRIHVLARSDSEADDNWYEHGLAHELANIFLWNEAGQYDNYNYFQRNPSWFPEGLTEYYIYNTPTVEDQYPPRGVERLNETIKAGDGYFSSLKSEQYDGGHILSMYLIDRYGEDAVWKLLRNDAPSWDDAVEEELGVTQAGLERNFYRWAEENVGGDYSDQIEGQNAEAEIDELKAELEEKEKKINMLEEKEKVDSSEPKAALEEAEAKLEEKENKIDKLEAELEKKEKKIKQLKTEIDEPKGKPDEEADAQEDEKSEASGFIAAIAKLVDSVMTRG